MIVIPVRQMSGKATRFDMSLGLGYYLSEL